MLPDDSQGQVGIDLDDHLGLGPDSRGQIEPSDGAA